MFRFQTLLLQIADFKLFVSIKFLGKRLKNLNDEYDHFDDILTGNTSYSDILKEFDSAVAAINNGNLSLIKSKNLIDEMDETKDDLFLLIKDDSETKQFKSNIEIDLRKEQRSAESHEDKVPYKPLKEILTQKVVSSVL